MEENLRRAHDELDLRVRERTTALAKVNEELRKEIAEREKTQEELRRSEELLRNVLELLPIGVWIMDPEGRVSLGNAAGQRIWGGARYVGIDHFGEYQAWWVKNGRLIEPEEWAGARAIMKGETSIDEEIEIACFDGTRKVILNSAIPLRNPGQEIIGAIIVNQDMTEHRASENMLREQAALLDLAHDAIIVRDLDGTIFFWNHGAEQMYGWAKEEALGNISHTLLHTEFPSSLKIIMDEVISKGRWEGELVHSKREGIRLTVASRWAVQADEQGNAVRILEINTDITERKTAEQGLLRLVKAIEQITEGVAILDVDRTVLYVNPAFESISSLSRTEVLGRQYDDILSGGGNDKEMKEEMNGILCDGGTWTRHLVRARKDGSPPELDVTVSPVKDTLGTIINYVVLERDVTQEVRLEQHMRQTQKMEALGTLAGGIAHDFNNILMPIIINTEMALLDAAEASPFSRYLQLVLEAANRGKDLIRQIITFSRQREEAKTPVEVAPVIQEALKFLRASIPKTIEIRDRIDAIPGTVLGDPTQIQQVLMNLCSNAAHAMRERGGILEVSLAAIDVEGETSGHPIALKPGSYVKLSVGDTGQGMDRETLERVFDPFFTTKRPGEGTGLGLAVVHGIVKNHAGTITTYSEKGKGSTFNVFLPLIAGDRTSERLLPKPTPKGTERILLIDDEEIQIRSVKPMLEKLGYNVVGKTNVHDALELFRAQPAAFDLVITDQTMPQMMGQELAKELLRIRPDVPIILCTGFSELTHEEQVKAMGIREYVMKPFSSSEIAERIQRAIGKIS
jgi:PAS domain S-box-containing protein